MNFYFVDGNQRLFSHIIWSSFITSVYPVMHTIFIISFFSYVFIHFCCTKSSFTSVCEKWVLVLNALRKHFYYQVMIKSGLKKDVGKTEKDSHKLQTGMCCQHGYLTKSTYTEWLCSCIVVCWFLNVPNTIFLAFSEINHLPYSYRNSIKQPILKYFNFKIFTYLSILSYINCITLTLHTLIILHHSIWHVGKPVIFI